MNIINLNERIKNYRIEYPLTQAELSEKSGLSLRSIQLFENGADIKLSNFIKILEALDLADNMEVLVPDVTQRPSYMVKQTYLKKRVRKTDKQVNKSTFKWGDE